MVLILSPSLKTDINFLLEEARPSSLVCPVIMVRDEILNVPSLAPYPYHNAIAVQLYVHFCARDTRVICISL